MPATKVIVDIPDETVYDVRIGDGLLDGIGAYCRSLKAVSGSPQALVISDSNVAPLYMSAVKGSLGSAGYESSDIVIPAGEESKSAAVATEIWEAMAALGFERDGFVVALGGGVVGDIAGFTASTYMRGMPVVQVPTSLLAMVDSSVGGKTGINLEAGKNLVGTFKQPSYVCASTDTLRTLPDREWVCGCAEIAKSAIIDSDEFFFWLDDSADALASRDSGTAAQAITKSVVFKANVVAQDKTESCGIRECLNYGHTLAHAIEKLAGYGMYSHGAAVAQGMRFAAFLGERLDMTNADFAQAQAQLLDALDLPDLDWHAEPSAILEVMKCDKKARSGNVRFVIAKDVGQWEAVTLDDDAILQALEAWENR